jgi:hypothetical protein
VEPVSGNDTSTYLDRAIIRTPLYPWFLDLVSWAVGATAFAKTVTLVQLAAGLATVTMLAPRLASRLGVAAVWAILIWLVLVAPFALLGIGNQILTESLAYTLFLWALYCIALSASADSLSAALRFLLMMMLLMLTRPQFQILIPVAVAMFCWLALRLRSWKVLLFGVASIAASMGVVQGVEIAANAVRFDLPLRAPLVGLQMVDTAIYLSDEEDRELFAGDARQRFDRLISEAKREGLTMRSNPNARGLMALPVHYNRSYVRLLDKMLPQLADVDVSWSAARPEDFLLLEERAHELAWPLLRRHWPEYLRLYVANVLHRFGFSYPLLCLGIAAAALVAARRGDRGGVTVLTVLVVHAANISIVALLQPVLFRYTFYSELSLLAVALPFLVTRVRAQSSPSSEVAAG